MNENKLEKYKNIINMPHHISKNHPQMSIEARAAQFGSFDALTGYEDEVKEAGRVTEEKRELNEEKKKILNDKINYLKSHMNNEVEIEYYIPDKYKNGGKYDKVKTRIKKINVYSRTLVLENKIDIKFENIVEIYI